MSNGPLDKNKVSMRNEYLKFSWFEFVYQVILCGGIRYIGILVVILFVGGAGASVAHRVVLTKLAAK